MVILGTPEIGRVIGINRRYKHRSFKDVHLLGGARA